VYTKPKGFAVGLFYFLVPPVVTIPDFVLGFEENGLNLCQDKACEQKYHSRTRCSTARTFLRTKRSHGKELETFYQNPNANSGIIAGGFLLFGPDTKYLSL